MPTLVEVARRAGVAPMTVSRVVNDSGPVSDDVRARVEKAIAETGYVPNAVARSLRSSRTHTLAIVVPDLTNPFFTTIASGAQSAAADAGLMLIVANTDERPDEEERALGMLLQRRVDGILLVAAGDGAEAIRRAAAQGTPVVAVDRRVRGPRPDSVRADSRGGAAALGRLLVSLGHRRMVVLAGPPSVSTSADRVAGFRRALADAGIDAARVLHGAYTIESGRAMAAEAMRATPRPTAVFAANNFIAIGVLHALEAEGIRVPEDVAVVGFDDLPPSMVTFPFLTVATQPAGEMGRQAVALLLDRFADPGRAPREIVLPTELIVRRSSGAPLDGALHSQPAARGTSA